MKILVTGGAGYIGSTIAAALETRGHTPVVLDNLIAGRREFVGDRAFYEADVADHKVLEQVFKDNPDIFCTIHCAALKVVPESMSQPYDYYRANVANSLELFKMLPELGCHRVVFSSSASVYDAVSNFTVTESSPLKPLSPYARTKYMMEMVLQDFCEAYDLKGIALRYFNPIGADPKMRTGLQDKNPSHILGRLVGVALGNIPEFQITGVDWPTRDGTGIRDYIHVWDLAQAHVQAVERFDSAVEGAGDSGSYGVINLGTGNGVTVREFVEAFQKVYGSKINHSEAPARPGDIAGAFANADRARDLLGWTTKLTIEDGISDSLKWGKIRDSVLGDA